MDLAVIAVPRESVEETVTQCGRAGVRAVVVMTGGSAEGGGAGAAAQRPLVLTPPAPGMPGAGPAALRL